MYASFYHTLSLNPKRDANYEKYSTKGAIFSKHCFLFFINLNGKSVSPWRCEWTENVG